MITVSQTEYRERLINCIEGFTGSLNGKDGSMAIFVLDTESLEKLLAALLWYWDNR
jgi:hypothetical protein